MAKLSVNVNKVATLRNTRDVGIPSVCRAAEICLQSGAAGITVHPRPDQRHIRPKDVQDIAELLKDFPGRELNMEGNPFHDYLPLVRAVKPAQCTLVPDEPSAFTSNAGWKLHADNVKRLAPMIQELKQLGCRVSLFMDADAAAMATAAEVGADRVELYTEPFARDFAGGKPGAVNLFAVAAKAAKLAGLGINAGHDLNLANLPVLIRAIPFVAEVSIGHALIADALELGLAETVRRYLAVAG